MNTSFVNLFKKEYYKKLILVLSLFMLVPVITVGTISFNVARSSLLDEVNENNAQKILEVTRTTETMLKEIDNQVLQLMQNIFVIDVLRTQEIAAYSDINKVLSLISNTENSNPNIHSIYIYKDTEEMLYTSNYGMTLLNDFYDKEWYKLGEKTRAELMQKRVLWLGLRTINYRGVEKNVVTLVRPVFLNQSSVGMVVVNINQESLYQSLLPVHFKDGSQVFVLNSQGQVISSEDIKQSPEKLFTNKELSQAPYIDARNGSSFIYSYNNIKYITSLRQSLYNGWFYAYMIPEHEYTKPGKSIEKATLYSCLLCILAGLIMAFFTSRKMYNPVTRILDNVRANLGQNEIQNVSSIKNEFEYIQMSFTEIYNKSRQVEMVLDNNAGLLVETYFKLLLEAEQNVDVSEIQSKLKNLGISIDTGKYLVFIIDCPMGWNQNDNRQNYIVDDIFKYFKENNSTVINIKLNRQNVFIINNIDIVEKQLMDDLSVISEITRRKYDLAYTVGIGNIVSYDSLSTSYHKAQRALQRKFLEGIYGVYEDISEANEHFIYKPIIDKIVANIKLLKMENVKKLLNELTEEIKQKKISYILILQIYFNLYVKLFLILEHGGKFDEGVLDPGSVFYENIRSLNTIDELNEYMYKRVMDINVYLCKEKDFKNSEVITRVVNYINENYNKPINLNDTAQKVLITPTYLGLLFKDELGCTFLDYLTNVRIEKAKGLLTNTRLSVIAVSKKVGYDNEQSFIRNFKKLEILTPNQYRIKFSTLPQNDEQLSIEEPCEM